MTQDKFIDEWTAVVADPMALYYMAKQIDAFPGIGTWPIMAARVNMFFGLRRRQYFYEPLSDYHSLLSGLVRIDQQNETALPQVCIDHVGIAFEIFDDADAAPDGRLQLPTSSSRSRGIHAVAVTGWRDAGETIEFVNSWGRGWGIDGCGSVGHDYLDRFLYDAWRLVNVRYGLTRHTYERFEHAARLSEHRAVFMRENPRLRIRVRYAGLEYRLVLYETLSVQDGCVVEVIELRNRKGIRVAWTELFHIRGDTSVAKEFFVWPPFRRRGYGTILDAAAVMRSHAWGSSDIAVWLHEPDALVTARRSARFFAASRGYRLRWRTGTRPPTAGVASKAVSRDVADQVLRRTKAGFDAYTSRADPRGVRRE